MNFIWVKLLAIIVPTTSLKRLFHHPHLRRFLLHIATPVGVRSPPASVILRDLLRRFVMAPVIANDLVNRLLRGVAGMQHVRDGNYGNRVTARP